MMPDHWLPVIPFGWNGKSVLLLFFFVNGILFTLLLTTRGLRNKESPNLWLAGFVFLASLYISPFMLGYGGWYSLDAYREWLFHMPLQHLYLLGPVFYFYVRSLTGQAATRKSVMVHFIPGIGYILFSVIIYLLAWSGRYNYYADGRDPDLDFWYQFSGFLHMLVYFTFTLLIYRNYRRISQESVSYAEAILYRWLQQFLVALLLIMILRLLFFVMNPEWGEFGSKFWYYTAFSTLVYFIALQGYTHTAWSDYLMLPGIPPDSPDTGTADDNSRDRVVDDRLVEGIRVLLEEEKIYTRPDLTLHEVASHLEASVRQVSAAVNDGFSMNFNDLINQYRVRAFREKILAGAHRQKSLLGLALDCGFNSKSTFNRAFKKHEGQTPGEFVKKHR